MKRALLAVTIVLLAENAWAAEPTGDDEKRACFGAVDEAQRLHIVHKLVEARDLFLQCARPVCPALFRNDCVGWLAEVQAALPSVVFGAKGPNGQDLVDVHVFVDRKSVANKLVGTSTDIDPGPHVFRFEWEGHGAVVQKAVIREGEKDRQITAAFAAGLPESPPVVEGARTPIGVWILGGIGVAGAAGFAALFVSTDGGVNQLRGTCAPNCSSGAVDAQRTKYALGYASLGVGIASLGVATTWFVLSRSKKSETVALSVEPTLGGGKGRLVLSY